MDVKENYKDSKGDGHLNSTIATPGSGTSVTDQRKINDINTMSFFSKATYTEPLSKTAFVELDYSATLNNSASSNYSYDKAPGSGDYSNLNDTFSSNYKYNVLTNQGGVNFRFVYKKLNFNFGSDVSNTGYLQTDKLHGDTSFSYSYVTCSQSAPYF